METSVAAKKCQNLLFMMYDREFMPEK